MKNETSFKQGHVKKGGRKTGTPNKVTSNFREVVSEFLRMRATPEQMAELYDKLSNNAKANFLTKMFSFVTPRMQEHEIETGAMNEDKAREILSALIQNTDD